MKDQLITKKKVQSKVHSKKLIKVNDYVLEELIFNAQHQLSPVGDYSEITDYIRNTYSIDINEEDTMRIIGNINVQIAEQETELLYKQYGY